MAKYIDEESFEEIVYDGMYEAEYRNALKRFHEKAVDAVPVVHGTISGTSKMAIHELFRLCPYEEIVEEQCSNCRRWMARYGPCIKYDYCPHCGARMDADGERREEENDG